MNETNLDELARAEAALAEIDALIPGGDLTAPVVDRVRAYVERAAAPSPAALELTRSALRLARKLAENELEQRGSCDANYEPRAAVVIAIIDEALSR